MEFDGNDFSDDYDCYVEVDPTKCDRETVAVASGPEGGFG